MNDVHASERPSQPRVSVVVVSDYAGSTEKSWDAELEALHALAHQEFDGPVEFILCEAQEFAETIPEALTTVLPNLRVEFASVATSYELKNHAVHAATGELVAVLDADCTPGPQWVSKMVAAFEAYPDAWVISGRTVYPGNSLAERLLSLLTRSYLDPGRSGPTRFISNNNSAARRDVLLKHPMPTDAGPFANRIQSEAMLRDGARLYFEPAMRVEHDFEGWAMENDIRRNIGFGTVTTRLKDARLPHAKLIRLGPIAIPAVVAGKILNCWRDCLRCAGSYGVRWFELPLALSLGVYSHLREIPGMLTAYRGGSMVDTSYR